MSNLILCDKYLVKNINNKEKPRRLVAIFSFNEYGDQGKHKYTFHFQGDEGIETIPGAKAKLIPLKWYQKDTYKAGLLGGVIGFLASIAILGIKNYFGLN